MATTALNPGLYMKLTRGDAQEVPKPMRKRGQDVLGETFLLVVTGDDSVKVGLPPTNRQDSFSNRAATLGKLKDVSRIACSPDGELFCIRDGDLYRGPLPSNKDLDWFSVARRVGRSEWRRFKLICFHPNGELYATTNDGDFYKGPKPDNEHDSWIYSKAKKIGAKIWHQYDAMFFDNAGTLYTVSMVDILCMGPPPTDEKVEWKQSLIGMFGWHRLSHFMGITPDKKLWCIDKYNGNIYRTNIPVVGEMAYVENSNLMGWGYHCFRFLLFVQDKRVRDILSFDFLPEEGEKVSENPEVLEEKIFDNRRSSSKLRQTFSFQKTIKESSSFTHDHGFTFDTGAESVKAGIPFLFEGAVTVTVDKSTDHNWSFTKDNETENSFESSTQVELEAGKAIRMVASVMKAEINVPYKARVRTLFGSEREIKGMWKGVSHYNLTVKGEDYDKDNPTSQDLPSTDLNE